MNFKNFIKPEYIFSSAANTNFESWYLYLALALLSFSVGYFIFTKIKKRIKVYQTFDKYIIWGYLILGFVGLFIWFSRSQNLPTFSIRFFSYLWLALIAGLDIYILYHYKKEMPGKITEYYEKLRKEKYLK